MIAGMHKMPFKGAKYIEIVGEWPSPSSSLDDAADGFLQCPQWVFIN